MVDFGELVAVIDLGNDISLGKVIYRFLHGTLITGTIWRQDGCEPPFYELIIRPQEICCLTRI
jgi:hypothetical protein